MTIKPLSWSRGEYTISTDPARLDIEVIHGFLRESYWSPGIPRHVVERAIANSLNFGMTRAAEQVGFARIVSDLATYAYLADVFVLPAHRGRGLSKWLMECIVGHPDLQGLRRWMLMTRDAHELYSRYGFAPLKSPAAAMERWDPLVYQRAAPDSPGP